MTINNEVVEEKEKQSSDHQPWYYLLWFWIMRICSCLPYEEHFKAMNNLQETQVTPAVVQTEGETQIPGEVIITPAHIIVHKPNSIQPRPDSFKNKPYSIPRIESNQRNNRDEYKAPSRNGSFISQKRQSIGYGKPPSLMNFGATCYLNSAFQGISACDTFVREIDYLEFQYRDGSIRQLRLFKELMDILNGCSSHKMELSQNSIFRNWNKPGQQDSYELLAYALNQVYNELRAHLENEKKIPRRDLNRWLAEQLPMRCILTYKIKCECSMETYSPLQSDLALHVTVPNNRRKCFLNEQIDQYFSEDLIEDFVCDSRDCKKKKAYRLTRLQNPVPKTICIHLQRTFWNGRRMSKINSEVKFDLVLRIKSEYIDNRDISPLQECSLDISLAKEIFQSGEVDIAIEAKEGEYNDNAPGNLNDYGNENDIKMVSVNNGDNNQSNCAMTLENDSKMELESDNPISDKVEEVQNLNNDNNGDDNQSNSATTILMSKNESRDLDYHLVSVIVHSGGVDGGHYVCYKRVGEKWFLTNDSFVREVRERDVLASQAYILFYEQL